MRAIFVMSGLLAITLLAPTASYAETYPWCAQYGGLHGGARNCGFMTYGQCMATISGMGGFCERNSFYAGPERPVRYKKKTVPRDY